LAVTAAEDTERDARSRLDAEASTQLRREAALGATEARRTELTHALAEIDAALDETRAQRVADLSAEAIVPAHLAALGEVPTDPGARQVWCGLACRIESYRDRHPDALGHEAHGGVEAAIGPRPAERWMPDPEWDALAGHLRHGAGLVAVAAQLEATGVSYADAHSWIEVLDHAGALLEAQGRTPDHGLDLDSGLGLGW
jgi:hypothetical protein